MKTLEESKAQKEEAEQLPEWVKGNLTNKEDFSVIYDDTASAVMPGPHQKDDFDESENESVDLDSIQMFGTPIEAKGVIAVVDRRNVPPPGNIQVTAAKKIPERVPRSDSVIGAIRAIDQQMEEEKQAADPNDFVVMFNGKIQKVGDFQSVCETVLKIVRSNTGVRDDDIVIFRRIPLSTVLDAIQNGPKHF